MALFESGVAGIITAVCRLSDLYMSQRRFPQFQHLLPLALLVIVGLALRLHRIADVPLGGHGDVSWIGINALDWLQSGIWPYYVYELYAPEPAIVYLAGISIQIFGPSFFASRLPTVIASLLVVPAGFAAAYWLTADHKPAIRRGTMWLFAIGYAVSFYAIVLGKTGQRSQLFPLQLALIIALFAYAWHTNRCWAYALTAAVLALANYTYIPARLVPILLCVWVGHQFFADRTRFRTQAVNFGGMLLLAALLVTPQLVTYLQTPEAFFARSNQDAGQLIFLSGLSFTDLMLTLVAKFAAQFGIFVFPWRGFYSEMGRALLPLPLGLGAFVGIIAALPNWRDKSLWWPLTGIIFMTLTDVVSGTQTAPHGLRMIGVLPFAFLLGSRGLMSLWQLLDSNLSAESSTDFNRAYVGVVATLVVGIGLFDFFTYHSIHIPALRNEVGVADRLEHSDVFITELIKEHSDEGVPILITWDDFTRANVVYLLSDTYPERVSALSASDTLDLPGEVSEALVVKPSTPFRPRHDGLPPDHDWQSWVMLYDRQMIMLPPMSAPLDLPAESTFDTIEDWQESIIARVVSVDLTDVTFASVEPANADFNSELRLAGYTLPGKQLQPGTDLWVTLYWQAINGAAEDYETYVQILDDQGKPIAQAHRWTLDGVYRTRLWPETQLTPTRFRLSIPEGLPPGRYTMITGPYSVLRNIPVPVVDGAGTPVATHARIERFKVALNEPIPNYLAPPQPIAFSFEGQPVIELDGLELVQEGQQLTLQGNWRALADLQTDHTLFIHVVDADEQIVAQLDTQPRAGQYPTGIWDKQEIVPDQYVLGLNELSPGQYDVYIGWYTLPSGERLSAIVDDSIVPDARVNVGQIELLQ